MRYVPSAVRRSRCGATRIERRGRQLQRQPSGRFGPAMLCAVRIVIGVFRITGVILLALLLALCLWIEVAAGTGDAREYVQPGYTNVGGATAWFVFALVGPAVVVGTMFRSRRRPYGLTDRALHIEKWGLVVAIPLGLFGVVVIASQWLF
jgi:hypothetical protein